jgi:hypothetical protein
MRWHAGRVTALDESASDAVRVQAAPRWVAPVFAVLGAATMPWTAYLAMSLPQQANAHHYRVAWVGFDIMLVVVLLATAYAAWRGRPLVGLLAASAGTMLVVDAWFDVTTARHSDLAAAILSAALVELPLAGVCGWIALHVDQVIERRLRQLARRADRLRTGTRSAARARVRAARAGAATAELGGRVTQVSVRAVERTIGEAEDDG